LADVYTLILAGGIGSRLSILTEQRAKPAVPFGGKFRIIDFALSNCTNSRLADVGLLTQYRPMSLIDHVGTGSAWDLDRSLGGLHVLQPTLDSDAGGWYRGTADAVTRNLVQILRRPRVEDVLILSGDHVYAMDYRPFIRYHRERRFAATVAVTAVAPEETRHFGMIRRSHGGIISEFQEKPDRTDCSLASMGIYVFRRNILVKLLLEDRKDPESSHDFGRDIFPRLIRISEVGAYVFEGYWQDIGTLHAFYEANMKLLNPEHSTVFSRAEWPIRTPSTDAPPVRIQGEGSLLGSTASNGAVILGRVSNSILFPGAVVGEDAVVEDSILMNNVHVSRGARVTRSILDKRVRVGEGSTVGGRGEAPPNRLAPDLLCSGVTLLGKDVRIGGGTTIGRNACIGGRCALPPQGRVADGESWSESDAAVPSQP